MTASSGKVKYKFSNLHDRKAMGFLKDLSLDLKEASTRFAGMLTTCQKKNGELDLSSFDSQARMARAAGHGL